MTMPRRRTMLTAVCTLVLAGASAPVAEAQHRLVEGDRIRVSWRDRMSNSAEGRYQQASSDSIAFTTREGVRLAVPLRSVQKLDVALGVRTRQREFALGGAGVGGVIGAIVGAASAKKEATLTGPEYPTLGDPFTGGVVGGLAGGLAGAFVGGLIGRGMQADRWQSVDLRAYNVSLRIRMAR
jgi:outer membrane lipoprotein SlyB